MEVVDFRVLVNGLFQDYGRGDGEKGRMSLRVLV